MRDIFAGGDVNNTVNARSVYGGFPGASTGIRAGALTPYAAQGGGGGPVGPGAASDPGAGQDVLGQGGASNGKPALMTWVLLVILLLGLMWVSKRVGTQGGEFANVKVSAWNVLITTLSVIIGLTFLKGVTAYVPVPGLTPLIHATG